MVIIIPIVNEAEQNLCDFYITGGIVKCGALWQKEIWQFDYHSGSFLMEKSENVEEVMDAMHYLKSQKGGEGRSEKRGKRREKKREKGKQLNYQKYRGMLP